MCIYLSVYTRPFRPAQRQRMRLETAAGVSWSHYPVCRVRYQRGTYHRSHWCSRCVTSWRREGRRLETLRRSRFVARTSFSSSSGSRNSAIQCVRASRLSLSNLAADGGHPKAMKALVEVGAKAPLPRSALSITSEFPPSAPRSIRWRGISQESVLRWMVDPVLKGVPSKRCFEGRGKGRGGGGALRARARSGVFLVF